MSVKEAPVVRAGQGTRRVGRTLRSLIRRHPFTTAIVAIIVVAQLIAVLIQGPIRLVIAVVGTGVRPVFVEAHW